MAKKTPEVVEKTVDQIVAELSYEQIQHALRLKEEERAEVVAGEITEAQAEVDSAVAACDDLLKADRDGIMKKDAERRDQRVTPLRDRLKDLWAEAKEVLPKDLYAAMRPTRSYRGTTDSRSENYWISAKFQFVKQNADLIVFHANYVSEEGTRIPMGRTSVGDFEKDSVAAVQNVIDQIEAVKEAQTGKTWSATTRDMHRAAFSKRFAQLIVEEPVEEVVEGE